MKHKHQRKDYELKAKIIIFNIFISLIICTSLYMVKIYDIESRYQLLFTWSSKSIINTHGFYLVPFLLNLFFCFIVISIITKYLKLKNIFNKNLLYIFIIIFLFCLLFYSVIGYFIFDTEIYMFEPDLSKTGANSILYCRYFSIYDSLYLNTSICGRQD